MGKERSRHYPEAAPARSEGEPLYLNHARKLFFLSFEHSQGNTTLQRLIFDYLHHLHPKWTMDDAFSEALLATAARPILNFAVPRTDRPLLHTSEVEGVTIETDGALKEIKEQLRIMRQCFNCSPGDPPQLLDMAAIIVKRDLVLLAKGRPRDPHLDEARMGPKGDRWLSHFVYYGLEGHATGVAEYDSMYADVVATIEERLHQQRPAAALSDRLAGELYKVITGYQRMHPDRPVAARTERFLEALTVRRNQRQAGSS